MNWIGWKASHCLRKRILKLKKKRWRWSPLLVAQREGGHETSHTPSHAVFTDSTYRKQKKHTRAPSIICVPILIHFCLRSNKNGKAGSTLGHGVLQPRQNLTQFLTQLTQRPALMYVLEGKEWNSDYTQWVLAGFPCFYQFNTSSLLVFSGF